MSKLFLVVLSSAVLLTGCQTYLDRIYREAADTHLEQQRFQADYVQMSNSLKTQLNGLKNDEQDRYEIIVLQLTEISTQLEQLEKEIVQMRGQMDQLKFERGGLPGGNQAAGEEGDAIYTRALQLYNTGSFDVAVQTFSVYLGQHSGASRAGDAQYWLGECFSSQDKLDEALAAYLKTANDYPASSKAPTALFRAALIYEKQSKAPQALATLKQITIAYPNYDQMERIQAKIKELERG